MSRILPSLGVLVGWIVLGVGAEAATLDDVKERGSLRCGTALSIPGFARVERAVEGRRPADGTAVPVTRRARFGPPSAGGNAKA